MNVSLTDDAKRLIKEQSEKIREREPVDDIVLAIYQYSSRS
ncbi:MAG: hypothetical protein BAJALOKI3v1_890008 [Promethearchaeota archaeon]|nr:MAG: hypothetical protein BAJALOKI3v1_890008 [Candidatus Lokiarchaeota archaeon]